MANEKKNPLIGAFRAPVSDASPPPAPDPEKPTDTKMFTLPVPSDQNGYTGDVETLSVKATTTSGNELDFFGGGNGAVELPYAPIIGSEWSNVATDYTTILEDDALKTVATLLPGNLYRQMGPMVAVIDSSFLLFLFICGGMLLLVAAITHFSGSGNLDSIKSRTVGDGQHGTARWAYKKEIQQTYKHIPFHVGQWRSGKNLPKAQGLVLGCVGKKNAVTALVDTDDIHYIIIDCGLKHELLTVNALVASDYCIVPVQAHFLASEGIPDVLELVKSVRERFNPKLQIAGILLTMYQSRPQLCQSVRESVGEIYGEAFHVFERPIEYSIKVAECPAAGQSIFDYAPKNPAAASYRSLAEEVLSLG